MPIVEGWYPAEPGRGELAAAGDEQHPANGGAPVRPRASLLESLAFPGPPLYPRWMGQRIGWEEGAGYPGDRLAAILAQSGPKPSASICRASSPQRDYYVANKLMKGYLGAAPT